MYRFTSLKQMSVHFLPYLAVTAICYASLSAQAGETTNKIGITMVDIPAGSFAMGSCKVSGDMMDENKKRAFLGQAPLSAGCSNSDSDASDDETPQHRVSLKAFQMGKTEVTLGQFKQFIVATGNTSLLNDEFIKYNAYGDDAPVVMVSWHDAQTFIDWMNKTAGAGYRLPSEAEWEYACRAGGNNTYCGGNNLDRSGWHDGNSGNRQHAVGGKNANAWGLYDMSGNAVEWVQDCWHSSYRGAPANGSAWTGSCASDGRVLRGGSWFGIASNARAALRFDFTPDIRQYSGGFRVARTR